MPEPGNEAQGGSATKVPKKLGRPPGRPPKSASGEGSSAAGGDDSKKPKVNKKPPMMVRVRTVTGSKPPKKLDFTFYEDGEVCLAGRPSLNPARPLGLLLEFDKTVSREHFELKLIKNPEERVDEPALILQMVVLGKNGVKLHSEGADGEWRERDVTPKQQQGNPITLHAANELQAGKYRLEVVYGVQNKIKPKAQKRGRRGAEEDEESKDTEVKQAARLQTLALGQLAEELKDKSTEEALEWAAKMAAWLKQQYLMFPAYATPGQRCVIVKLRLVTSALLHQLDPTEHEPAFDIALSQLPACCNISKKAASESRANEEGDQVEAKDEGENQLQLPGVSAEDRELGIEWLLMTRRYGDSWEGVENEETPNPRDIAEFIRRKKSGEDEEKPEDEDATDENTDDGDDEDDDDGDDDGEDVAGDGEGDDMAGDDDEEDAEGGGDGDGDGDGDGEAEGQDDDDDAMQGGEEEED